MFQVQKTLKIHREYYEKMMNFDKLNKFLGTNKTEPELEHLNSIYVYIYVFIIFYIQNIYMHTKYTIYKHIYMYTYTHTYDTCLSLFGYFT